MRKILIIAIIISSTIIMLPVPSQAFSLVPCGRDLNRNQKLDPAEHCTFKDLIILIVRLINYLISAAFLVAVHRVISVSLNLVTAMGNAEKIQKGREGLSHTVVGFVIIIVSFLFINLLVNGLFGSENFRKWFYPQCIYGVGDQSICKYGILTGD